MRIIIYLPIGIVNKTRERAIRSPYNFGAAASLRRGARRAFAGILKAPSVVIFLPALDAARNSSYIVVLAHGDKNTYDQELWDNADERVYLGASFFKGIQYVP